MDQSLHRLTHDDYTVACICPMGVELAPVEAMLDEMHPSLPTSRDWNCYTLGRMGAHNVVIAVMPEIGNNSAATVATQLLNDFRSIRFGLLVGIGGGIPGDDEDDIRLGDVVISKPTATSGGVVQFDRGEIHPNGQFERTGTLKKPPAVLMANVHKLEAQHRRIGNQIPKYLLEMLEKFPNMEEEYVYPGIEHDQLFEASYHHEDRKTCQQCDRSKVVERAPRKNTTPRIHYGTIGSSNEVVKDSETRDKLRKDLGILCVEMEAAGLMDEFSCLVIRGICDYADSHKNKIWQPYAAAAAAAYAKELLSIIPAQEIVATTKAADAFQIPRENLLHLLPYAAQSPFDSSDKQHDPICLPDTRVSVLNEIMAWASSDDERCIFWLNGMAGTGKSTVARTIARQYHEQGCLGASFFFSKGGGDVNHAGKFFTTIAKQLGNMSDALKSCICKAIEKQRDIANKGLREQWRQLVLWPLSRLDSNFPHSSLLLVVDALDECDSDNDIRAIVHLLAEARLLRTIRLRVFITSRPEIPIRHGFYQIPEAEHQDFVLHNISPSIVDHDISIFLEHNFRNLRRGRPLDPNWPSKHAITHLIRKSSGLFIWAATAYRFISEGGRFIEKRLSRVLEGDASATAPEKQLNKIYITVLKSAISDDYDEIEKEDLHGILRATLGAIVILFSPLSIVSLAQLLHIPQNDVGQTLYDLHSILDIPQDQVRPIRLHHPSFRDFLLNKDRCSDPRFYVDEKKAHMALANHCIQLMSNKLQRDICNLRALGTYTVEVQDDRIEQCLPADLQYSCQYWVQHLQKSAVQLDDNGEVYAFLRNHLLHWLEALSLMRKTSQGVLAILSLESMVIANKSPHLYAFIHDAKRFALNNRSIIEQAPLQIYCSVLFFAPEMSIVREQFKNQIPYWICKLSKVQKEWSSLLQTLEGHSRGVSAVAFSPDGKLVASASNDKTVRLWDPATGASLQTLEGHSHYVSAVAFSPDGKLVASASDDKTVRLWDPATGASLQTLETDSIVGQLSFSNDGQYLDTDRGQISISSLYYSIISPQSQPLREGGIFVKGTWVVQGIKKVLWLPPIYRATCAAAQSNVLVMGHASGRVSIFRFDAAEYTL